MSNIPIVAFMPAAMDACALYRMYMPHLNVPGSRFTYTPKELGIGYYVEAQVAIVQRQVSINNYKALKLLKEHGFKLVYDLDDNIWSLPAYNPGAVAFKESREGFERCAELADVITVSTRGLKSAVGTAMSRVKDRVVIVPNGIDFNLFRPPQVHRDDGSIVIGWAGSNTHAGDVGDAWSVLPDIVHENENVILEVVGGSDPPESIRHHSRVVSRPWIPVGEYPARLSSWGWDISIAPLEENRFNKSKSNIKILEAAAINAAILVSDVQPYSEFFALCKSQWPLCHSRQDWYNKLTTLVQSQSKREEIVSDIRRVALARYDMAILKDNWIKVFQDLCG